MPRLFFREAIARALHEEMTRDSRVILMGQDIGIHGGSYAETRGLFEAFGQDRVRDTPVAEAVTIGMAAGAAAAGLRPVAFITYVDFLMVGLDPLVNYAAKLRFKSAGQLSAPLVIKATAGAKGQGPTHAQSLDALLMNTPGLSVVAPSTAGDAYGLLKAAIRSPDPVVYIDHKRLFPLGGEVPAEDVVTPIGVAAVRRTGTHVTIVAHSYMSVVALQAAGLLAKAGIESDVIDLRTLWPIDWTTLMQSIGKTGAVLFVEEGQEVCGVGAELAFGVLERMPGTKVARLGTRRMPVSASPVLEDFAVPNAARIVDSVNRLLGHESVATG